MLSISLGNGTFSGVGQHLLDTRVPERFRQAGSVLLEKWLALISGWVTPNVLLRVPFQEASVVFLFDLIAFRS